MMVTYREKMKNSDYNNLQYISQSKWKWVISVVFNLPVKLPTERRHRDIYFQRKLEVFNEFVTNQTTHTYKILGFITGEIQPCGGRFHLHSVWSDFGYTKTLEVKLKEMKGINSFKIERFYPKCITDKDYLWYILKEPVGVFYNDPLMEEIVFGKRKVKQLEKQLQKKEGYYIPTRFNHLKTFISDKGKTLDMENGLKKLIERR